jgi:hypothetical protein
MDQLLALIALNLTLLCFMTFLLAGYVWLTQYLQRRWHASTATWFRRILQVLGCLWTCSWLIMVIRFDLWDEWPRGQFYWAYRDELVPWLQAWMLILLPSMPGLMQISEWFILRRWQNEERALRVTLRAALLVVGFLTLLLAVVTPLAIRLDLVS